jgi:hypothetical protein
MLPNRSEVTLGVPLSRNPETMNEPSDHLEIKPYRHNFNVLAALFEVDAVFKLRDAWEKRPADQSSLPKNTEGSLTGTDVIKTCQTPQKREIASQLQKLRADILRAIHFSAWVKICELLHIPVKEGNN